MYFVQLRALLTASQHEGEHELGHEQGLDGGEEAVVEGERLEDERTDERHPPEEPQWVAQEVPDEPPSFGALGVAGTRDVLRDDIEGIRQGREQREQDAHGVKERARRPHSPRSCAEVATMIGPNQWRSHEHAASGTRPVSHRSPCRMEKLSCR